MSNDPHFDEFIENLERAMGAIEGMNDTRLSDAIKSKTYINKLRKRGSIPGQKKIAQIAKALEVAPADLIPSLYSKSDHQPMSAGQIAANQGEINVDLLMEVLESAARNMLAADPDALNLEDAARARLFAEIVARMYQLAVERGMTPEDRKSIDFAASVAAKA